ncbi:MAG: sensor histidine kinase, partial [Deltaproteobacteria bacterium]
MGFRTSGLEGLSFDFHSETNLFRVIEEALQNVSKHANASRVTIELLALLPSVILLIQDDGRGFDVKKELGKPPAERRKGLWSMEQRVSLLRGRMTIRSTRG